MNNFFKTTITFILAILTILIYCSCERKEQMPSYTLSQSQCNLVDTIYNSRSTWEKYNGNDCTNIRYVEKNGNKFLLCTYKTRNTGVDFMGQNSIYARIEVKYTISEKSMRQANANEYGSNDYGIVTGMFSYSTNATAEDKKLSIARTITNQSQVVIPSNY